jgi:PAS domain S-box-containing protein
MMDAVPIQVLLVEDNAAYAAMLTKEFTESPLSSFVITHARCLSEAVSLIRGRRFEAVLLDLDLPDSRGIATLAHMQKEKPRDVPIVVVTASEDEALRLAALQAGADDYLVKGVLTNDVRTRSVRYVIERKRASEASLTAERRLVMAVEAAQMGTFDWDLKSGKLSWSDQCLRLFGLTSEQFGNTYEAFEQLVHADDRIELRARVDSSLSDDSQFRHEYRIVWPDGSQHWIEARWRVFHDGSKRPLRLMGTALNISPRKASERASSLRENEMAHLSRVATMGQMASGLAHELNQPLAASLNYGTACLMQIEALSGFPPGIANALREMMNETRRAGAIIARMRSFVAHHQPARVSLDINELVHESIKMMEFNLQPHAIRPHVELCDHLPNVLGDPVQIEQVLINLLFNGVESMAGTTPSQRSLIVRTEMQQDGAGVQVSVIDTGIGILPDNLNKLFQPFFSTKSKGLGMGLNISRSIIEGLGGRLWAVANPEHGMRFSFTLPLAIGVNP